MSDTKRLPRLAAMMLQLQSKRLVTAPQLARRFGVSVRTIYRDLRALEEAGVPVLTEEGRGYRLVDGYHLPPVSFTEAEAHALVTAGQLLLTNRDASLAAEFAAALDKLKAVMRPGLLDRTELLAQRVQFRPHPARVPTSHYLSTLQLALTSYQPVKLTYRAVDPPATTERVVEPFALYSTQENWLLVAWCRLRGAFRTFRLDRMARLEVLTETFAPHPLTLPEYFARCQAQFFPTPDTLLSVGPPSFGAHQLEHFFMEPQTIPPFMVIGLAVRTTNQNNQASHDIGALWQRFLGQQLAASIPNRVGQAIYCLYTDYELDHTRPYTAILGCPVSSLEQVPPGLVGHQVPGGQYAKHVAKGSLPQGAVYRAWAEIWQADLARQYSTDFEVYTERAYNPEDAEVDIFVAVKG
ncbi:MAG: effector binding domain-containing protein [Bernardetiaceae bacterium]|nr:effector binding domain-containing protein [Bernardetiaceae bacterium]